MDRFSSEDESSDESRSEIPVRNAVSPRVLNKINRYVLELQSSIDTKQFKGDSGQSRTKIFIFKDENDTLAIASSKAILDAEASQEEYRVDPVQGTLTHNDVMYLKDPINQITVISPSGGIMQFEKIRLVGQHKWKFDELNHVVTPDSAKRIVELLKVKDDRARNDAEIIRLLNAENAGGKKQQQRSTKRFKKRGKKPKTRSRRFHSARK